MTAYASRMLAVALAALVAAACGTKKAAEGETSASSTGAVAIAPKGNVLEAAENDEGDAGAKARAPAPKLAAGEKVDVPAGKVVAGSTPGDKGRDPVLEPALREIELGAYTIDRWLYPNDPSKPPLTGVSRAKASELCQTAGGRLCTELEWERACKGPSNTTYPGGDSWDAACAKQPDACASGFGVAGMGGALREWTSSNVDPIEKLVPRAAVARGARADASGVDHRCARRATLDATSSGDDLGFRCCHGAPNAATIASPAWGETFRKAELSPRDAAEMFATVRELEGLGREITFFKEPDDPNQVLAKADAGAPPNTTLTTAPQLWNPVPGEEILLVTGRAKKDAFLVAFYRLPGQRYRIASSMILKDEKASVVLAVNPFVRRKVLWSVGCFDCKAESGFIAYREDNRVVITQK